MKQLILIRAALRIELWGISYFFFSEKKVLIWEENKLYVLVVLQNVSLAAEQKNEKLLTQSDMLCTIKSVENKWFLYPFTALGHY